MGGSPLPPSYFPAPAMAAPRSVTARASAVANTLVIEPTDSELAAIVLEDSLCDMPGHSPFSTGLSMRCPTWGQFAHPRVVHAAREVTVLHGSSGPADEPQFLQCRRSLADFLELGFLEGHVVRQRLSKCQAGEGAVLRFDAAGL